MIEQESVVQSDQETRWSLLFGVGIIASGTAVIACTAARPESVVKFAGLLLQLLGMIEVILSINEANPLGEWIDRLRARLPRWFRKRRGARLSSTVHTSVKISGSLDGVVRHPVPQPPTLEGVADALDRNVDLLHEKIKNEVTRLEGQLDARIAQAGELIQSLQRHVEQHRTDIHVQFVRQARITWRSTAWLLLGVVASTIPDEIVCLVRWIQG